MKVLQEPQIKKYTSLIDQSDYVSKKEGELDIVFELVDKLRILYNKSNGALNGKYKSFRFLPEDDSKKNLINLANFMITAQEDDTSNATDKFCDLDEKLTYLVNNYIKYTTNRDIFIETYTEDIEELIRITDNSYMRETFNYTYDSICNLLRYSFAADEGVETFETIVNNDVDELCLMRSNAVIYLNKLSSKILFKDISANDQRIYDTHSDLYQKLLLSYNSCRIFRATNRAVLIINKAFNRKKIFEIYRDVKGDFVITDIQYT